MKLVIDIEANGLNPYKVSQIWCIICRDVDTQEVHIFREVTHDDAAKAAFLRLASRATLWIGHNILGYDFIVLNRLIGFVWPSVTTGVFDTLIASKLLDYSRPAGHSLEAFGEEFGYPKLKFSDFSKYSKEMEVYCERDVELNLKLYRYLSDLLKRTGGHSWDSALALEHEFQLICNELHQRGFAFDSQRATRLLDRVADDLKKLDDEIFKSFPPREQLIREFVPKLTKFGTISRTSVPRVLHSQIHLYIAGETYRHTRFVPFNPSSHKQLIEVLTEAGWQPTDKTQTHKDTLRALHKAKGQERIDLGAKLGLLSKSGWKINEDNLATLPPSAPSSARSLAKRILLESRRRTLTEWLGLVNADTGRIHGKFYGIGAWTHRMAHQEPNTANIPREFNTVDDSVKLLGKELRQLWIAPKKRLLVGVDAEGIQLRIFAHYVNDPEFIDALVRGSKSDKSDPHSFNQRVLGSACKTRQAAKRFLYALLLGAGLNKLAEILGCSTEEVQAALDRLLGRLEGFKRMREEVFPRDAKRGYFIGLDGRKVKIPGESLRDRQHLAMSGYLQNGEAIIVKRAALIATRRIRNPGLIDQTGSWFYVDIVHDELQSEVDNNYQCAIKVAEIKAQSIVEAGEYYKLNCPMAGSYTNDSTNEHTIGRNWYQTH